MAVRKNASKTAQKAKLNVGQDSSIKIKKSQTNKAKNAIKRTNWKVLILGLVFLLVGVGGGAAVCWGLCRNDTFEIYGQEELTLTLEEKYLDDGVKVVSFGRDVSNDIEIETNLKRDENGLFYSEEVGTFYIKYHSNDFKYGKLFTVERVRLITFVEASEGGV